MPDTEGWNFPFPPPPTISETAGREPDPPYRRKLRAIDQSIVDAGNAADDEARRALKATERVMERSVRDAAAEIDRKSRMAAEALSRFWNSMWGR